MLFVSFFIGYIISVIGGFVFKDKNHDFLSDGDILGLAVLINILFVWLPVYYLLDYIIYN